MLINEKFNNNEDGFDEERDNNKYRHKKPRKKSNNNLREWIFAIALAFVLALLINKFLFYKVYIPSSSMVPTLNIGDHLFATKVYNLESIQRGDVIIFYSEENKDMYIKRLIGLPGDKVEIKNGEVSVNGELLKEDYVKNNENYTKTFNVPEDKYFFLGDNRANSNDGRKWVNPYVDGDDIEGKAQIKVYPFNDFGSIK